MSGILSQNTRQVNEQTYHLYPTLPEKSKPAARSQHPENYQVRMKKKKNITERYINRSDLPFILPAA